MAQNKTVNGVISEIWIGTASDGDYGRSAPCNVTIDGAKYSGFVKEFNGVCKLQTKVGDVYTDLKSGMQVAFTATQKDGSQYWNFKPSSVMILASGSAAQQQNTQAAQQPTPQQKVAKNEGGVSTEELRDMVTMGQAATNALLKGLNPSIDMLNRVAGYYKKVL